MINQKYSSQNTHSCRRRRHGSFQKMLPLFSGKSPCSLISNTGWTPSRQSPSFSHLEPSPSATPVALSGYTVQHKALSISSSTEKPMSTSQVGKELRFPSSGQGVILKRNSINGTSVDTDSASDWMHHRIYQIGQSEFPLQTIAYTGEITAFVSPDNSYDTITRELRNAQYSIDMNMYEFTNPFLYQELLDALKRNVTVRIFMEGSPIGGIDDREVFILTDLAAHGGLIRFIVSDDENHVNARYQFDHAKYLLIDNETVIVESCNWAKTGVPKNPTYGNREWGIVVRDKDVATMFWQVFQDDWDPLHTDSCPIEAMNLTFYPDFTLDYEIPTGSYLPQFDAKTITGSCTITPVFSPDTSEQVLLDAIDAATSTIYVQQLYIYRDWGETTKPACRTSCEQIIGRCRNSGSSSIIRQITKRQLRSLMKPRSFWKRTGSE